MSNTSYAHFIFPLVVFDRHEAIINELFPDADWPDGGGYDHTMEFINPESYGTLELENKLVEYGKSCFPDGAPFAYLAHFDSIEGKSSSIFIAGNGSLLKYDDSPIELEYGMAANELKLQRAADFLNAKATFEVMCGKENPWTNDHEHVYGNKLDCCPKCGSDSIEGEGVDVQGRRAVQECMCHGCGHCWSDIYALVNLEHHE